MELEFFGQFLINKGIIEPMQLVEAIDLQETQNKKIGQLFLTKGILTEEQVDNILKLQRKEDIYFGEAAQKLGYITKEIVRAALNEQAEKHLFIGNALIKLGYLKKEDRDLALQNFEKEQVENALELRLSTSEELKDYVVYVNEFISLSIKMVKRLGAIVIKENNYKLIEDEIDLEQIAIQIGFKGLLDGCISEYLIMTTEAIGTKIASKMFSTEEAEVQKDMIEDAVSEMANVICGHACNNLSGVQDITITTPNKLHNKGNTIYKINKDEKAILANLLTPWGFIKLVITFLKLKPCI